MSRDELLESMSEQILKLNADPRIHVFVCHPSKQRAFDLPEKHEGFDVLTREHCPHGELTLMERRDLGLEWEGEE